ncbi:MAG: hypothetical protein WC392_00480 [Sulfuricella sp.]|jgi:hypothetical protein
MQLADLPQSSIQQAGHPAGIRLCVPSVAGRGAGLGNEFYPWAKAWLAAQAIGGIALPPAFGMNPRQYWRYFGTSRLDWISHRVLLQTLPRYTFTEQDYLSTGEHDFRKAVAVFAERLGWNEKRLFALEVGGMWGGFLAVREARDFILARLYAARGTAENLTDWRMRLDPGRLVVAVHIRAGDFKAANENIDYRGCFNRSLPLDWYIAVCDQLRREFGNRVQFQLFTDGQPEALEPFIRRFSPVTGFHQRDSVCSDLLAMANADLLVCSVSTFSLWGAFLSHAPYLWFAPQLQEEQGMLSLWGHEAAQRPPAGATAQFRARVAADSSACHPRGVPVSRQGEIPSDLLSRLELGLNSRRTETDLALYGVVPLAGAAACDC